MNRRRSVLVGSVLLSAVCVLAGCGGGAETQKGAEASLKTFDSHPCDVLSKSAMVAVIGSVSAEAGVPALRPVNAVTRYAGDYAHCRYILAPKSRELDGSTQSTVTVYNEQTFGAKLMRACHDRAATTPVPAPATASGASAPSPSRGKPNPSAQPSTGTPSARPSQGASPAGPSAGTPQIGDETCVDALGQVRVRLGDRYFSVLADLAIDPPQEVADGSLTATDDPARPGRAERDERNQTVAQAVAREVVERLRG